MVISCDSHDELEAISVRRVVCTLYLKARAEKSQPVVLRGRIVDIYIRNGREALRLDSGPEVFLDDIQKVEAEGRSIEMTPEDSAS